MQNTPDLKSTLNLPQTSFPMKANLPQNEPKWLAKWAQEDLYGQIRSARQGAPIFTLHDGPPYANGRIHLGTALNKILKDFVVKSKTLAGFNAPYLPGWDCHGLPIEINVDKELGPRKGRMSVVEIRQACRRYAEKFVDLQRGDFQRLGILGEWQKPYLTMDPEYEAVIAETFLAFLERGYVYRGRKSIYWCISDKTALAEAEVEYEDHRSRSIYVKYPLVSDPADLDPQLKGRKVSVIIWTTTPWTLPASMAVAFHPQFQYVAAADVDGEAYILESRRYEPTLHETGLKAPTILARIPGSKLEHIRMRHPFLDREVPGVLADYVTAEDGTGSVHTAPGHGREDYQTGVKYGLEVYCPVGEAGEFTEGLPEYKGKRVFDANEPIVELLKARGTLVGPPGWLTHSYPHCWRCHNPIIFRASDQWFIDIDHSRLREVALEAIKKVRWSPEWGEERMANMLATRPDWCVSRQRVWGVPITIFYCEACAAPLLDAKVARPAIELFRREGADAWHTHPVEDLASPGAKCTECGETRLRKEKDILDVWFDSGSSHLAVLGRRPDLPWPSDLYLEGGDQYRGWFQSSLLLALGTRGSAPYRQVVTPGWVLDAEGRAMSKSLGTGIDPNEVIKTHGAEILRLWVASVDFREDVVMSPEILARLSEAYFKLRNTFRYCLSNLYDFDPERDCVGGDQLEEIDAWALVETAKVLEAVEAAYQEYAFHKVYRAVYDFATVSLSAFYFDILKDRLYTAPARSVRRRAAQSALYRIAEALAPVVAPLMCFTAEEVWSHLPAPQVRGSSVHLATFAKPGALRDGIPDHLLTRLENWPRLIAVRDEVLKALEAARQQKLIRSGLEARVSLEVFNSDPLESSNDVAELERFRSLLEEYQAFLPALFIVSQVEILPGVSAASNARLRGCSGSIAREGRGLGLRVLVQKARGQKCARCWNYSEQVGKDERYPEVCERCSAALREIENGQ
ncbi:MAG: isoleucine--tRNA ligase [Acidobacteria bacterium]|nr:MAG: isoleucine--tRNA ligase [Acidobacteriota bacterium]